ncbi:MAG: hypothetical protein AVDCRST_MAG42-1, partial [uncultured Chthoniobacterales bacterium]
MCCVGSAPPLAAERLLALIRSTFRTPAMLAEEEAQRLGTLLPYKEKARHLVSKMPGINSGDVL